MECGKTFSVGSGLSDEDRVNPPKIGEIINCGPYHCSPCAFHTDSPCPADRFFELTKAGVPRFPSFVGVAIDKESPKDATIRMFVIEYEPDSL